MSGEETFCFSETWRPEWGSNPQSPTFQADSFNHCTRAPALYRDRRKSKAVTICPTHIQLITCLKSHHRRARRQRRSMTEVECGKIVRKWKEKQQWRKKKLEFSGLKNEEYRIRLKGCRPIYNIRAGWIDYGSTGKWRRKKNKTEAYEWRRKKEEE